MKQQLDIEQVNAEYQRAIQELTEQRNLKDKEREQRQHRIERLKQVGILFVVVSESYRKMMICF
jgi:hypothetical protein